MLCKQMLTSGVYYVATIHNARARMNSDNLEFDIRKTLSELMEQHAITEAELARRTQVPPATVNRLMAGATPDPRLSTIRPLARYFNVSIDQLIGDEPLTTSRVTEKFNFLPIIPWQEVPASSEFIKSLDFSNWQDWEPVNIRISPGAFALTIHQRTLGMPFAYKALLIIEPDKEPNDGDYVIVYHKQSNSVIVKQLIIDGKDVWLNAPNDHIPPILMTKEYKICGVIVRVCLPFNTD